MLGNSNTKRLQSSAIQTEMLEAIRSVLISVHIGILPPVPRRTQESGILIRPGQTPAWATRTKNRTEPTATDDE